MPRCKCDLGWPNAKPALFGSDISNGFSTRLHPLVGCSIDDLTAQNLQQIVSFALDNRFGYNSTTILKDFHNKGVQMKTVTVYGISSILQERNALTLHFEPFPGEASTSVNDQPPVPWDTSLRWTIEIPDDAKLSRDSIKRSSLNYRGRELQPNEVFRLSEQEGSGFTVLNSP